MSLAEIIGDPTDLGVVESVWGCMYEGSPEPTWRDVGTFVRRYYANEGHPLTDEEADDVIRQAILDGDVEAVFHDDTDWCLRISGEQAMRTARRYWYWQLQLRGVEMLALFHWPDEDTIARTAVEQWMAAHGVGPNWDELNATMAEAVEDADVANQMAHNAVICGAIKNTDDPLLRFVLGDYTPFDWDSLL